MLCTTQRWQSVGRIVRPALIGKARKNQPVVGRIVYISEVRCAAVYGLHFLKCSKLL
jgi:hypothetical protein